MTSPDPGDTVHQDNDNREPTPLFGAAAGAYLAAGWPSVLPLPPRKKKSPPEGFTGRAGAFPTRDQVEEWTATFPDGNLALRLPPDVVGIDVDAYGDKPGDATLAMLEEELGPLPPTILTSSRDDKVSGIRLFRTPPRPTWHDPGPGIEIIHFGWRYVIAAPSIHDETGRPYRWLDQRTGEIMKGAPRPLSAAELPHAWAERLSSDETNEKASVDRTEIDTWIGQLATGNPCKVTRDALDAFHADLRTGGSRHDAMLDATGRLVRALERGHQGGPAALSEAHAAFVTLVTGDGTRNAREAEAEWQRALDGAYALVAASPTPSFDRGCRCGLTLPDLPSLATPAPAATGDTDAPETDGDDTAGEELSPLEQMRASEEYQALVNQEVIRSLARTDARYAITAQELQQEPIPPLIALDDFLAQPDPEVAFRIDSLWPADGRCLLAAQYKAGKTTTVGNILRSLADGHPLFATYPVTVPDGRIVLLDDELHENTLRRWLRDQDIANVDAIRLLPLRGKLSTFNILDPAVRAAWAARLRDVDAAVVILDCLRPIIDALGLSEDKDVGKVLGAFDELLEEAGVTEGLIVHHMGHHGERSRGDSRLRDWPDAEWKLVREQGEDGEDNPAAPRYFSAIGRDVEISEQRLQLMDGRRLEIIGGSRKAMKEWEKVSKIIEVVIANPGISQRQLPVKVREMGGSGKGDRLRELAMQAIRDGYIDYSEEAGFTACVPTVPPHPGYGGTPPVTVLPEGGVPPRTPTPGYARPPAPKGELGGRRASDTGGTPPGSAEVPL